MGLYQRVLDRYIRTPLGVWTVLHVVQRIDKRLMRWSKGSLNVTIGTGYADSSMLLRCTGAQSGKAREVVRGHEKVPSGGQ